MCGRVTLSYSIEEMIHILKDTFYINHVPNVFIPYQYNIAPMDPLFCMIPHQDGYRLGSIPWGYPNDYDVTTKPLINIRSEKASDTALFKDDFRNRRCIIFASGFVEWNLLQTPFYFQNNTMPLLLLGGIWGKNKASNTYHCGILTQEASPSVALIHDRMPVAFDLAQAKRWLNHDETLFEMNQLIKKTSQTDFTRREVSRKINNSRYKEADAFAV